MKLDHNRLNLTNLFSLSDEQFRQMFRKTPLWRTKREGLLRNAAIVLGNQRAKEYLPVLRKAASQTLSAIVRDACIWAIEQIESE